MPDRFAVVRAEENSRGRIDGRQAESCERTRQLPGSVFAVVDLGRSGKKACPAGCSNVGLEGVVRIVEVTENQIEAGKVSSYVRARLGFFREKSCERRRFYRANSVRVEALLGDGCDMFVAENLEADAGKTVAQQPDRRKRQDEIPDGAAADDQD